MKFNILSNGITTNNTEYESKNVEKHDNSIAILTIEDRITNDNNNIKQAIISLHKTTNKSDNI